MKKPKTKYPKKEARDKIEAGLYRGLRLFETHIYRLRILLNTPGIKEELHPWIQEELIFTNRLKSLFEAALIEIRSGFGIDAKVVIAEKVYDQAKALLNLKELPWNSERMS